MVLGVEVGLSPGDFVLHGDPASPLPKRGRSPPQQFSTHFCCGQTALCITMPFGMEVGLSPADCVRWGLSPSPERGRSPFPIFGPCLLWPNCWMDQDGTWHGGGPWSRPHCARWGHSSPPQKRDSPPFLAHVYCGQTAGWIKTPLGTAVDNGPGHFILDGFPAIRERGTADPSFRPMPIVAMVAHLSYC